MAVRSIVTFPDPRLRAVAAPVTAFDDALRALADDLVETMRAAGGIGITAPHIGIATRLVALELSPEEGPTIYVNPKIVWASDERIRHPEGSVSMPGVTAELERPARVRVAYRDVNGAEQIEEADGLRAVCHQHESDQLDGIFWIRRLSSLKRDQVIRRYQKLQRAG
ncbi:MAG TPA: peptide deformylase [Stellaceae bacterium]|jgi:peptide deformylase|nr:peptide deformylase [Stellaceae bacterium]